MKTTKLEFTVTVETIHGAKHVAYIKHLMARLLGREGAIQIVFNREYTDDHFETIEKTAYDCGEIEL